MTPAALPRRSRRSTPDAVQDARGAALHVDKILKGAKPVDLPVERPTRFDFVINLSAAQALGRTIPESLLQQATEVIHQASRPGWS